MSKRYTAIIALWALLASGQAFASVFGTIKAIVHDPQHRPIQGAQVQVQSRTSAFKTSGTTNEDGIATVLNIPVGEYDVTISSPGFAGVQQPMTVTSGNVQELHFALALAQHQETVEVSGAPELVNPASSTPETMVSRAEIAQTPGADRTNSLAMITDYTPGAVMVHDQLHVRGGHQVTWAIDGVPVPNTNIATNVGPQFNPKDIDYVEEQRGSYSAEFGDRTYGVFNVATRTGFERSRQGELVTSYGNYNTTDDQLSFGDHSDKSAYYFSFNGNRTDHGLATPSSANLHNLGSGGGVFTSLIFNTTANDQLRFVGAARTDHYQVPNDQDGQDLGIRDREREQDVFGTFSWLHTAGPGIVFTLSPSFHFNRAAFEGLGDDADRVVTTDNRASFYVGGQASLGVVRGRHNAKIGIYGFAQQDNTRVALEGNSPDPTDPTDPTAPPVPVSIPLTRQTANGDLEAIFLEDQFKAASWLTINAGVRFTRFSGLITETAGSPRLGVAIRIPHLNWVLRGSYGRFYQAPPLDTTGNGLQQLLTDQSLGFLPLRGERDEQREIGITIPFRGWAFEVDNFRTGAHNFFDHDAIENSNLFFPLTIEGARLTGTEVTVRAPRLFKKLDVHLVYSHQSAEGSGAVTGGLTDFTLPDAGFFFLDHDQRNTLSTGISAILPYKSWISGNVGYGSGFLNGDGPDHLPGYGILDLALGKSFGENWSVKLSGTNLANKHYFVDLSNTFGGSHFGEPLMVSAQVRYKFHY
ncbi:MAG TPA: TonB-dependent receptor [Candidatus Angelobacter sp.]|jgi:outer membrane receptor protein involved in Fe transport